MELSTSQLNKAVKMRERMIESLFVLRDLLFDFYKNGISLIAKTSVVWCVVKFSL